MMKIADQIAAKRAELAVFVTQSAAAVIAEPMDDAQRGVVALDLLRLMVASGLTPATPSIDVTPQRREIPARPVAHSDSQIAAMLDETGGDAVETAARLGCSIPTGQSARQRIKWASPQEASTEAIVDTDIPGPEEVAEVEVVADVSHTTTTRPQWNGRKRKFTDEDLLHAVKRFAGDTKKIANHLNCSKAAIVAHRSRLGVAGKWGRAAKIASETEAQPVAEFKPRRSLIDWNDTNRAKLVAAATRTPRSAELAIEFGTTASSIQTALSRCGITKQHLGQGPGHAPADLSQLKQRKCLTCGSTFLSEGNHNRRCNGCKSADDAIAA